jgi:uncharacterized membrane protein
MSDNPIQLVVAAFQDEKTAKVALKELKRAQRAQLIKIENAAVLRKDEKGKLHIKETGDLSGGRGAAFGGVAGAAIGLLAGPALVVPAAVGALVGGLTAKLRDKGFSDARLQALGEGLTPGSSAIIAVVEHKWVGKLEEALAEIETDLLTLELQADIAEQLEAGHDVAYSALASQEGFAVGRVAGGEDEVEGGFVIVDDAGVTESQFVATEDGFAVLTIDETEDEIKVEGVLGTFEEEKE